MKRYIFFLCCLIPLFAEAQPADLDSLFSWKAALVTESVQPGSSGIIEVTLTVAPHHIVYQHMTSVKVTGPDGFRAGKTVPPQTHSKLDPIDGKTKQVYVETSVFQIPFTVDKDTPLGDLPIKVIAKYQGCSQEMCFFPQTRELPLTIHVGQDNEKPSYFLNPVTSDQASEPSTLKASSLLSSSTPDDFFSRGYILTFLFIYAMGILTSFTPCVYPLIPITVTIFGARKTQSTLHAFSLALTYVLGIAGMYSALGYFAATTGAVFGQFMSNPWLIGGIAAFFVAMGVSMLGAFELQLPLSLQTKLGQMGGEGYLSAFIMGMISGIIAAPCTGPVLAGILAYVATTGNPSLGMLLLLIYSLGLGTLFLVIGTYSGMISRLPKSGSWMENVKSIFAIILFVCALYFLKNAFPALNVPLTRNGFLLLTSFVILGIGLLSGAVHLTFHSPRWSIRSRKIVGIVLCTLAIYLPVGSQAQMGKGQVQWYTNLEEGLKAAHQENKRVMIDFWADWCTICEEIDVYTFHDEQVADKLNRDFVCIKVDLSRDTTPEAMAIISEYQINGLPLLVFFDTKGNRLPAKRINQFINAKTFLRWIEDIS